MGSTANPLCVYTRKKHDYENNKSIDEHLRCLVSRYSSTHYNTLNYNADFYIHLIQPCLCSQMLNFSLYNTVLLITVYFYGPQR